MVLELKTELAVREPATTHNLSTPAEVANLLRDMTNLAQESFVTLTLNSRNRLIARHLVSLGTVSSTLVHPREVFRPAIRDGAKSVIVAHNHPSGDPSPSSDDLAVTRRLVEAGRMLEIEVLDHVIIGGGEPFSLRESGLVAFN